MYKRFAYLNILAGLFFNFCIHGMGACAGGIPSGYNYVGSSGYKYSGSTGYTIKEVPKSSPAFVNAVDNDDNEALDALLASSKCKQKIDDQDVNGDTALSLALKKGNSALACRLLIAGATRSLLVQNNSEETPLMIATQTGDLNFVDTVISCGASVNLVIDKDGNTILINIIKNILSKKHNLKCRQIRDLIFPFIHPAQISHVNSRGLSALFYALENTTSDKYGYTCSILISKGADPLAVRNMLKSRLGIDTSIVYKELADTKYNAIENVIQQMCSARAFYMLLRKRKVKPGNAAAIVNKAFGNQFTKEFWQRAAEVDYTLWKEEKEKKQFQVQEIANHAFSETESCGNKSCTLL